MFGAGPAGAAAALALARQGLRVALVDQQRPAAINVGETVPPTIKRSLARLGIWATFLAARHQRSAGMVVSWGKDEPYENEFIYNPYGCGWHLNREAFDQMLVSAAKEAGTTIYKIVGSPDCDRDGRTIIAHTETEDVILTARWLVDATGRRAWLARRRGVRRRAIDRMIALVRFGRSLSGEDRTFIEARPTGWWYAAQLPNNRAVAAFFTDADLIPRGENSWNNPVKETQLISGIIGSCFDWSPVSVIPASSGRLEACAGDDWIAIGDAAQSYDPCSGQGIVKALDTAINSAALISAQTRGEALNVELLQERADAEFQQFLLMRSAHYQCERRWPDNSFWARRRIPDQDLD